MSDLYEQVRKEIFELSEILRAVNLHKTTEYDAWVYNFRLNGRSVLGIKNRPELAMANMGMKQCGIVDRDDKIHFVVYALSNRSSIPNTLDGIKFLCNEFLLWMKMSSYKLENFMEDRCGLPLIFDMVRNGNLRPLQAAEIISVENSWTTIYLKKDVYDFSFDKLWGEIYFLKPLVEYKKLKGKFE